LAAASTKQRDGGRTGAQAKSRGFWRANNIHGEIVKSQRLPAGGGDEVTLASAVGSPPTARIRWWTARLALRHPPGTKFY